MIASQSREPFDSLRRNARLARSAGEWPAPSMVTSLRARDQAGIGGGVFRGHQPVLRAADEQRRPVDAVQPVLELGIVHVGFPGDQRERLPVARAREQLGVGQLARVRPPLLRLGVEQRVELVLRHGVDVGNVEPVDRPDLDADGAISTSLSMSRGALGRELGRGPAADRMADQQDVGEIEPADQFEIEVREVVDRVDPDRQARPAEARMHRRDRRGSSRRAVARNGASGTSPLPPCRNSSGGPLPPW